MSDNKKQAILIFGGEIIDIGDLDQLYEKAVRILNKIEIRRIQGLKDEIARLRVSRAIQLNSSNRIIILKSKINSRKPILFDSVNISVANQNHKLKASNLIASQGEITELPPNICMEYIDKRYRELSTADTKSLLSKYKHYIYTTNSLANSLKYSKSEIVMLVPRSPDAIEQNISYKIEKILVEKEEEGQNTEERRFEDDDQYYNNEYPTIRDSLQYKDAVQRFKKIYKE